MVGALRNVGEAGLSFLSCDDGAIRISSITYKGRPPQPFIGMWLIEFSVYKNDKMQD